MSCRNVSGSRSALTDREVFECSWKSMCGPNPKKITICVVVVLSIWASIILGLNVYKQVYTYICFSTISLFKKSSLKFSLVPDFEVSPID